MINFKLLASHKEMFSLCICKNWMSQCK